MTGNNTDAASNKNYYNVRARSIRLKNVSAIFYFFFFKRAFRSKRYFTLTEHDARSFASSRQNISTATTGRRRVNHVNSDRARTTVFLFDAGRFIKKPERFFFVEGAAEANFSPTRGSPVTVKSRRRY